MKRPASLLAVLSLLVLALAAAGPAPAPANEAARLNNLGVAYMNQQRLEQALDQFERAARLDPSLQVARLNQAIALLNLQRFEPASEILLQFTEQSPKNIRAWYNLGLLYRSTGQAEPALEAFTRAAELDPDDPDTHYFRGLLLAQVERHEEAIAAFERALALNPFHVSAEFGLARSAQRLGQSPRAREHLERFQRLTQEKLGAPMSLVYREQGRYSLAEQISFEPAVPPAIPVRFVSVAAEAGLRAAAPRTMRGKPVDASFLGPGACFLDYDGDSRPDLFLLDDGSGHAALYRNRGDGRFEEAKPGITLELKGAGLGCAAGDYDNDGWTDLGVSSSGGILLLRNEGGGTFRDVNESAGLRGDGLSLGITFFDYDHDGDLDLYVARFVRSAAESEAAFDFPFGVSPAPNLLWRNNGNGTFTEWTAPAGLGGDAASVAAVTSDLNNDRAIDLVVSGWQGEPIVFLNAREGAFSRLRPWGGADISPTAGVVVFDFDKDGWMDLAFTHWGRPGLSLWRNRAGKQFEAVTLPAPGWNRGWGLVALDFDNDGWLDLAAVGESDHGGEMRLLRNRGTEGFEDVTAAAGPTEFSLERPRALLTADYDGDGDTDLLLTENGGGVVLLRNDGGNKNHWLRVALKGLADNKSAIGTRVEVFAGTDWQRWEVAGASGYLGQSAPSITAGLGATDEADIVRMLWPTGVLQDEIKLAAGAEHSITEIDRRGSSCPVVFAWNGERFDFISDTIGPAVAGHWVGPGERNLPDPDEYIKIEATHLRPRQGRLLLRFMEPMEELIYLDQVRLLAVDHPVDVDIYPNERFAATPPFPESKIVASRKARLPSGAWDEQGRDVREALRERDRHYVGPSTLSPFKGFAALHALELDLGDWSSAQPLRLLLHGYTDYFTATSLYAAHQAGLEPILPYVDALLPEGRWVRVVDDMGFPAGLRRTMVADLSGRLPTGTRRIRIVTNLQIYWDQILFDTTEEEIPLRVTAAPLSETELRFRGYPLQVNGASPGDVSYSYGEVSPTGPYARHRGSYTHYGEVDDLLNQVDSRFVILGSGEEVALAFDATALPPLPPGWTRDYFFYANGFVKDMDFYEAHALTVAPLPFQGMGVYPYPPSKNYPTGEEYLRYLLDYNDRLVSGNESSAFRFQYHRTEN